MNIDVIRGNGKSIIKIEGDVNIYNSHLLKEHVIEELVNADELEIDLSGINEMGTCVLQIFLLARKEADRLGKKFTIASMSRSAQEVVDILNLDYLFKKTRAEEHI